MWTPVINNVVVIAVGGLFILTEGVPDAADTISTGGIHLLAIGTTLGIVIQSICCFPVLRRAGLSMRLRLDLRRDEIGGDRRMAGGCSAMSPPVARQPGPHSGSRTRRRTRHGGRGRGTQTHPMSDTRSTPTLQLFQLPYAIVGSR